MEYYAGVMSALINSLHRTEHEHYLMKVGTSSAFLLTVQHQAAAKQGSELCSLQFHNDFINSTKIQLSDDNIMGS